MLDAAELARMLASRAESLARELLPAGKREGQEWRVGSLAGEPGRSLAVRLSGVRAGIWADFSSDDRGDALDLVSRVATGGDMSAALAWARAWLGLAQGTPAVPRRIPPAAPCAPSVDAEAEARKGAARRLFLAGLPRLQGTPADLYLQARGIRLAELGRQPRALRFVPALANRESGRSWPALVAAITDAAGEHIATHRGWLHQAPDGRWTKAPLLNPRMTLAGYAGGCIRLWRGASGKPLSQVRAGEVLAIAEGLETALSVVMAAPELRMLCAVSLSNMGRILLPPAVATVILCVDNDPGNPAAARALQRAVDHFAARGHAVRIARPPGHLGDFNDWLRSAAE